MISFHLVNLYTVVVVLFTANNYNMMLSVSVILDTLALAAKKVSILWAALYVSAAVWHKAMVSWRVRTVLGVHAIVRVERSFVLGADVTGASDEPIALCEDATPPCGRIPHHSLSEIIAWGGSIPPPILKDCFWFLRTALGFICGTQRIPPLHAMISTVRLARSFGSWTWRHWSLRRCQCDETIALCEVATPTILLHYKDFPFRMIAPRSLTPPGNTLLLLSLLISACHLFDGHGNLIWQNTYMSMKTYKQEIAF
jgi:hypothetical protein